jgi:MFS family permease
MCMCSSSIMVIDSFYLYIVTIITWQGLGILSSANFFDKYGRRAMLIPSCILSSICMYIVALAFQLGVDSHQQVALIGLFGYLLFFGFGLSPGPWVINSEIYPVHVRGLGNAAATTTNWVANYVVSASFLTLVRVLGRPGVFISFGCIGLMGALWIYYDLPETANKTLEEIEELFEEENNETSKNNSNIIDPLIGKSDRASGNRYS